MRWAGVIASSAAVAGLMLGACSGGSSTLSVTGMVQDVGGPNAGAHPAAQMTLVVRDAASGSIVATSTTGADGSWHAALKAGSYKAGIDDPACDSQSFVVATAPVAVAPVSCQIT